MEWVATFQGMEDVEWDMDLLFETPTFDYAGKKIAGFECYWLPLDVANKARKKFGLEEIEPPEAE